MLAMVPLSEAKVLMLFGWPAPIVIWIMTIIISIVSLALFFRPVFKEKHGDYGGMLLGYLIYGTLSMCCVFPGTIHLWENYAFVNRLGDPYTLGSFTISFASLVIFFTYSIHHDSLIRSSALASNKRGFSESQALGLELVKMERHYSERLDDLNKLRNMGLLDDDSLFEALDEEMFSSMPRPLQQFDNNENYWNWHGSLLRLQNDD